MKSTIRIIAIIAVIAGFLTVSSPASAYTRRHHRRHSVVVVTSAYAPIYAGSPYYGPGYGYGYGYYSSYNPYYGPNYYYRPYYRRPVISFGIGF